MENGLSRRQGCGRDTQIEKMSKSRFNVVTPEEVINQYGADALRLYELFIGPLSVSAPWQTRGVEGVYRFLQRVWRLAINEDTGGPSIAIDKDTGEPMIDKDTGEPIKKLTDAPIDSDPELWKAINQTIKDVTEDTESIDKMNTAISHLMVFVNAATQATTVPKETVKTFLRLLAPYAPHIAEELWAQLEKWERPGEGERLKKEERLEKTKLIAHESWPTYDPEALKREEVTIVVQVNGKLRSRLQLPVDASKEEVKAAALADERIQKHVAGKTEREFIFVRNRLANIVV